VQNAVPQEKASLLPWILGAVGLVAVVAGLGVFLVARGKR
jgi:hypothetical protein